MDGDAGDQKVPSIILPYGRETGGRAFEEWSETVSTIFDLDCSREDVANFRFGFSAFHLGALVLGVSNSDTIRFRRTPLTIARSSIDHYLVQVYETGGLGYSAEGKEDAVAPGDVWILDLARSVDIGETRFRSTNLAIPRALLAPLLKDPDGLHGLKLSAESAMGGLLSRFLLDLSRHAPRMTTGEAVSSAQSTVHLIAGCVGSAAEAHHVAVEGVAHARLAALRKFIDAELANPRLGVDFLCKRMAISRASLYRLFEPFGGVHAHIRRRRLARCLQEIIVPKPERPTIAQIAYRWGFGDERSFNRAFRDHYGASPSEARAAGAEYYAQLAEARRLNLPAESQLGSWILDLMNR